MPQRTLDQLADKHAPTLTQHFPDLTLEEARNLVEQLTRQHMVRCSPCGGDGMFWVGEPGISNVTEMCPHCGGTGKRWPRRSRK